MMIPPSSLPLATPNVTVPQKQPEKKVEEEKKPAPPPPPAQEVATLQQEENVSISGSNARLMIMKNSPGRQRYVPAPNPHIYIPISLVYYSSLMHVLDYNNGCGFMLTEALIR